MRPLRGGPATSTCSPSGTISVAGASERKSTPTTSSVSPSGRRRPGGRSAASTSTGRMPTGSGPPAGAATGAVAGIDRRQLRLEPARRDDDAAGPGARYGGGGHASERALGGVVETEDPTLTARGEHRRRHQPWPLGRQDAGDAEPGALADDPREQLELLRAGRSVERAAQRRHPVDGEHDVRPVAGVAGATPRARARPPTGAAGGRDAPARAGARRRRSAEAGRGRPSGDRRRRRST